MKIRRLGFSLLEILISISIAAILFGVLFSKVREFAFLRKECKSLEAECLERQAVQIRLQEVFSSLASSESAGSFYTQSSSIHFQIEKTLDIDPSFIGKMQCSLSQEGEQLQFKMVGKAGQSRSEVLATKIKGLSLRFFSAKEKTWAENWSKSSLDFPAFLSLICKTSRGDIEYFLPIASTQPLAL